MEGLEVDREVESVMITTTPSSRDVKTRKRKREVEGLSSPSVDAVSVGNLRETAPMVLARCKTAAFKSNTTRSREENRGFHQFDIGGRLQAPEDKREKRFNGRTDRGSGCRQGMGLEGTSGHGEASDE